VSISKRVSDAFEKFLAGDPEAALFNICAAVGKTAKLEGGREGGSGYKEWVAQNIPLITAVGLGPALSGLAIGHTRPNIRSSATGNSNLEDLVYHAVRCGLYHDAELPSGMRITENEIGTDPQGNILIPKYLVLGLIIAVLGSASNSLEKVNEGYYFAAEGKEFELNQYWGRGKDLLAELNNLQVAKGPLNTRRSLLVHGQTNPDPSYVRHVDRVSPSR
jgi:hypothetical protein